jgi:DNA helicase IV
VVLDEAQDLSPMQLRAVGRRCSTGSATILGDIAQGTTTWATPSWQASLAHLGRPAALVHELDRGFRVPAAVISFAARLLPLIAPGLTAPSSVRDDPGSLRLVATSAEELWPEVVTAVRVALQRAGSVGLIIPDAWAPPAARALSQAQVRFGLLGGDAAASVPGADLAEQSRHQVAPDASPPRVSAVPATNAKGLEYDYVVVVEPATIAAAEPDERTGLRRLYVVLTRAVSGLTVVHARPLPGPLADPVDASPGAAAVAR